MSVSTQLSVQIRLIDLIRLKQFRKCHLGKADGRLLQGLVCVLVRLAVPHGRELLPLLLPRPLLCGLHPHHGGVPAQLPRLLRPDDARPLPLRPFLFVPPLAARLELRAVQRGGCGGDEGSQVELSEIVGSAEREVAEVAQAGPRVLRHQSRLCLQHRALHHTTLTFEIGLRNKILNKIRLSTAVPQK